MRKALVWQDCGRKGALFRAHERVIRGRRPFNGASRDLSMGMPHSACSTARPSLPLLFFLVSRHTRRKWRTALWTLWRDCVGYAALRARKALLSRRIVPRTFGLVRGLMRMLGIELERSTWFVRLLRLVWHLRLGRLAHHLELVDAGFSSVASFGDLWQPNGIENRLAHAFERAPPNDLGE